MTAGTRDQPSGEPILVVCCQGDDTIALFSPTNGEPLGTIPVGDHPVHATVANERVFVATMGERSIDVIDLDGSVDRIQLGVLGPSHFAQADQHVFVPCTGGDVVACVDPTALGCTGRISVGAEPHDIVAGPERIYVGSRASGSVTAIDPEQAEPVGVVEFSDEARIQGVAVDPAVGLGYAVDQRNAVAYAFTLADEPTVVADGSVGQNPYDLFIHDGDVYVPGRDDGSVTAFGPELTDAVRHAGFETPTEVVAYGQDLWVIDRNRPCLSTLGGRTCDTPAGTLHGRPFGDGIILSHYDDALVSVVDPDHGVRWNRSTPAHPFGIAIV